MAEQQRPRDRDREILIARIVAARVTVYPDNGLELAYVHWVDTQGHDGATSGHPENAHMRALLSRAEREGVAITRN